MMYGRFGNGIGRCAFYGGFGWWHLLIVIGIILVVVATVLIIRNKNRVNADDYTLNILKEKYINGEITEEEYINRKNVLGRK